MTKFNPLTLVALISLFLIAPAHAVNSINVQTFNPSTSDHFVLLEDGYKSEWPRIAKYYLGLNYNYVSEPLVALDSTNSVKAYNIIDSIQTFDAFFGFKAGNNFGLFIGMPIHTISYSALSPANFPHGTNSGIGDLKIMAKIRLTDDVSPTSVALIPEFHLPTGNTENFVSDASTYVAGRLAVERVFENFTLIGNVGYATASNAIYQDATFVNGIDYRKRLILGIGGYLPFSDTVGMNVEFSNINMIPFDKSLNPNDAYAGIRVVANDGLIFTGGASIGKIGGPGGSDVRAIAGVRYTLFEDNKQAPQPIALPAATPAPTPLPVATPMPTPVTAVAPLPTPVSTPAPVIIDSAPRAVMQARQIEVLTPISFENNSYTLTTESRETLEDVATLLRKNKKSYKKVLIDGHTSKVGTDKYNLKLSLERAKAVKAYLVKRGIPATSVEARGYGFRKPKVAWTDAKAESINRRVEFIIVK